MTFKYDLFISHNSVDKPWARLLAERVEGDKSGPQLRVFFDEWDIKPGDDIPIALEEALESSRRIGLIISPEALSSPWVTLERSTAIYTDPSARKQRLVPILKRDCKLPAALARLNHIDFRRESDFEMSLERLLDLLHDRPTRRGIGQSSDSIYHAEDCALIREHRHYFERAAFSTSCIQELFIDELSRAVKDTIAALNTGTLASREGVILRQAQGRASYKTPKFQEVIGRVSALLSELRLHIAALEQFFNDRLTTRRQYSECFGWLMQLAHEKSPSDVRQAVLLMDQIDEMRNQILKAINPLLEDAGAAPFPLIKLTSDILQRQGMGTPEIWAAIDNL
jgi:TIR domain